MALFDDDAARGGGFGMLVWGFGTVVAVVLGFASWQYAPPRPSEPAPTRLAARPDTDEVTGSIALADRAAVPGARVIGGTRFPATTTATGEPAPTRRDLEELRGEIRDLHKTIAQMGLSGDGVSRRIDRLEERIDTLGRASTTPVAAADEAASSKSAARPETIAQGPEAAEAVAAAVRIPLPRPEADQPAVTGSVPAKPVLPPAPKTEPTAAAPAPEPAATAAVPPAGETERSPAAATDATRVVTTAATPNGGAAAVDLGGYRSLAALRKSWATTSARHAEFGSGIEPLARLRETDTGMEVRLVAGPYASPAEAAKTCVRMRALGIACAVTGYTGQPLSAIR